MLSFYKFSCIFSSLSWPISVTWECPQENSVKILTQDSTCLLVFVFFPSAFMLYTTQRHHSRQWWVVWGIELLRFNWIPLTVIYLFLWALFNCCNINFDLFLQKWFSAVTASVSSFWLIRSSDYCLCGVSLVLPVSVLVSTVLVSSHLPKTFSQTNSLIWQMKTNKWVSYIFNCN